MTGRRKKMSNYSPYNITFLYGFMDPDGGSSFSFNADIDRQLVLTKGRCFERANTDITLVELNNGARVPKHQADRHYLHYIIDCWLDNVDVTKGPSEL
jgi:hypothetical protein